ncbi:MAG: hypothetical protein J6R79_03855 [Bacteroidaceae bacterium]|nr:hypothetical protein [Bacteroidaceae bacterium]
MLKKNILCLVWGVSVSLSAQIVVEQSLTSTNILIGEQSTLQTRVVVDEGTQVLYPHFESEYVPGVEILKKGKIDTITLNQGKRVELQRNYVLTSFDSALHVLPPFYVVANGDTVFSASNLGLKVNTVPVDTTKANEFAGPHSVVNIAYEWSAKLWLMLFFVLVLTIFTVYLIKRIAQNKPMTKRIVVTPPPPAHQPAMEAIERIRDNKKIDTKEELKIYYDNLTEVLRNYIEQRFGFNAMEMTSSEIICRLQQSNDDVALRELKEILETADLVKFAKYETTMTEADRSLVMAIDYVNTTKQKPEDLPKPEVKVVTVGEVKQQKIKMMMIVSAILTAAMALVLFGISIKDIYDCFL